MSEYDIIPDEMYENLPSDPHDKFLVLVRIAQANVTRLLDHSNSGDFSDEVRSQSMSTIRGIADALGIEGLPQLGQHLAEYEDYVKYQVFLASLLAKLRLQSDLVAKPHSVALGRKTKGWIQQEIEQLRVSI